jgi:hypothetical protein
MLHNLFIHWRSSSLWFILYISVFLSLCKTAAFKSLFHFSFFSAMLGDDEEQQCIFINLAELDSAFVSIA